MGRGTLRWATFFRKLKPATTFLQIWVVCQCNVGCRTAPTVGERDEQTSKGFGSVVESDPRSSLVQSVTLSSPDSQRSQTH
ncbi:hypothetical protein CesoFtcFv8_017719 [Champsocephalus esox]|uniref:Secreted protein n=1 Tax=Champsocephalus esox TaxID=159716 RepID=A0AAN8GP66_9TELE|nr:hypothetical protein CesoFtcFv8_017719 [Champsocephalus esox]